jgi:hypothetical protein
MVSDEQGGRTSEPLALHHRIKYGALLSSLAFVVVLKPLAPLFWGAGWLLDISLSLTLLACVSVIGQSQRGLLLAGTLALLPLAAVLLPKGDLALVPLRSLVVVAFLLYSTLIILLDVFSGSEATFDKLLGSICAYLLVGICFGLAYLAVDMANPGSFTIDGSPSSRPVGHHDLAERFSHYSYFSFITMSSVGYGDILPVSPAGRSLVIAQAVFGQFYMALMVGRLLALHVGTQNQNPTADRSSEDLRPS